MISRQASPRRTVRLERSWPDSGSKTNSGLAAARVGGVELRQPQSDGTKRITLSRSIICDASHHRR